MIDGQFKGFVVETLELGISVVTFNRPKRLNGLTHGAKRDLAELMTQAQNDDDVRVVVFTGEGTAFCAGDDIFHGAEEGLRIPELVPPRVQRSRNYQSIHSYGSLRSYSQETTRAVLKLDKPTIAAVNGVAIQSGLSLALSCDFRIAVDTARFGSATLRFGYLPDEGGHWLIVRAIGVNRAKEFMLRKRIISSQEALELGLVTEVVTREQLWPTTLELARELATGPAVALRLLKKAIENAADLTFEQAGDDIATKTAISDHHPDTSEGRAAYTAKRQPEFNKWINDR